jgi:CHAD domain-containing protein
LSTRFGDWAISKLSDESTNFFNAMPDTTADTAALHQLRIRAKALRYTIELVAPAFGPELRDEYYPLVEEVQERLGAVQDHVAAAAHLRAWAAGLEDSESHDTLRELAAEQDKRLDEVLGEFRAWWTAERADTLRRGLMSPHQAVAATPLRQAAGQT